MTVALLLMGGASARAELPAVFDLRNVDGHNYVTAIRDQGPYGTCWTFGLLASPESNLLMNGNWGPSGVETDEPNLSERHLDWWSGFNQFNNEDLDPPTGDGTAIHGGGNAVYLMAYMSRGVGMVRESDAPYSDIDFPPPQQQRRFHRYYARDVDMYILAPDLSNIDTIKQNVMTKGAVSTCMFTASEFFRVFNGRTVHYQPPDDPQFINHEIAIIGWDDAMQTQAPQGPGAWLIKNSWGTGWNSAEGGFFWISYYDKFAGRYPTFDGGTININHVQMLTGERFYFHDYHGWVDTKTDSDRAFNAFVAQGNELVTGVNFYTAADNVQYVARIYGRFEGGQLLDVLGAVSGSIAYRGFHTADLPAPVPLTAGDDFYIYLELSAGGQPYDRTFDSSTQAMPGATRSRVIVTSTAQPGQSYYWDGSAWQDFYYFVDPAWEGAWAGSTSFCMKASALSDCNGNGVPDVQDIQSGLSQDVNGNWLPDECEPRYVVYVDDDAPGDPGPGDPTVSDPAEDGSAAHPFDAFQEALSSLGPLNGNTEIIEVVALDGTYTGPGNHDVDFYNYDYGGYRNVIVRSQNGPQNCIVDVQGDYSGLGTAFLIGGDGAAEPILDGLTIKNAPNAGIYCSGYASTIRNCILSGNGNGIYGEPHCSPLITGCTIQNNMLGISVYVYHPIIVDCDIAGNEVAGIAAAESRIVVRNCTVAGNLGQGLDVSHGVLTAANCLFSGNAGSGVRVYITEASIRNCTVVDNASTDCGGGICIVGYTDAPPTKIENCIVWGNESLQDAQITASAVTGLVLELGYSDVQGGAAGVQVGGGAQLVWGAGNIAADPLRVAAGNSHLAAASPCIDAGAPVAFYANERDHDGESRVWDGDGDGTSLADIGADEFVKVVGDLNCDGVVDFADINPFVAALSSPPGYFAEYGNCNIYNADVNGDNQIDFDDINPYVALLTGSR
jgi:C1A family cysteine protease